MSSEPSGAGPTDPYAFGEASLGRSVAWRLSERLLAQLIGIVVQVVLARLLVPQDFAVVAITLAVVNILLLVVQGGFSVIVTQRASVTTRELSTLFWMSMVAAVVLYAAVCGLAGPLAAAYDDPLLQWMLPVVGTVLFVGSFSNIQVALAMRRFMFRQVFTATLVGAVFSAAVSIVLVLGGAGAWAIVAQTMVNQIVTSLALAYYVRWHPTFEWDYDSGRPLLHQGLHLLVPSLLYSSFTGGISLVIGKWFGPVVLGYYDRGRQIPEYLFGSLNQAVQSVVFPAMSKDQSNRDRVRHLTAQALRGSCLVIFPAAAGLAVVAPTLVPFALTDTWSPAVPYLQLYCLFYLHIPISHTNQRAILALGHTRTNLRLNIVEVVVGASFAAVGAIAGGAIGLMIGLALSGLVNVVLFAVPNGRSLGYGLRPQAADLWRVGAATALMALVAGGAGVAAASLAPVLRLLLQVVAGAVTFGVAARVLAIPELALLRALVTARRRAVPPEITNPS